MIGEIWNLIALQPVINVLIVTTDYLFDSFGLAIIALTVVVNLAMYPLTQKQIRASQAMQSIQPKMSELQKKYAKDKQKLAQEQMRLYRESGMNPAGCLGPMLIQMPIWIALYQSIIRVLAVAPEGFLELSRFLYSWPIVYSLVPLQNSFLWLDLAVPDTFLAVVVAGTMWLQQKMTMPATADPRQQSQSRMMLWIMPMMFGFLCLSFPSGLALFWATSSVIRIGIQYYGSHLGGMAKATAAPVSTGRDKRYQKRISAVEGDSVADVKADIVSSEQEEGYGESRDKRQDSGGSYTDRLKTIRRLPKRGGSQRRKRR